MASIASYQSRASVSIDITGNKKLDAFFSAFPAKLQKKISRSALRAGAKVIAESAKKNAPISTGALRKAIRVRAAKRSRKNKGLITVRATIGKDYFKGDTFYGAFLEFGHRAGKRPLKNRADKRPFVEGLHFMERALKEQGEAAKAVVQGQIARDILDEAGRGL